MHSVDCGVDKVLAAMTHDNRPRDDWGLRSI